uniref:Uncharacterized protein n=1 Tax=Picea glauca TaxID=3330 RepID=A0A101M232_PICGL|nr:hypothetical protein ABT39_MTgene2865 [Picea glauca]
MNEIAALTALTARSSGHLYRSHIDRSKGTDQEGKSDQEVGSNQIWKDRISRYLNDCRSQVYNC